MRISIRLNELEEKRLNELQTKTGLSITTLSKDFGSFATLVNGFFENAASRFGVEVDEFYSLLREFALREAELQRVRKNNYEFYEVFDIQNEEAVRT